MLPMSEMMCRAGCSSSGLSAWQGESARKKNASCMNYLETNWRTRFVSGFLGFDFRFGHGFHLSVLRGGAVSSVLVSPGETKALGQWSLLSAQVIFG